MEAYACQPAGPGGDILVLITETRTTDREN